MAMTPKPWVEPGWVNPFVPSPACSCKACREARGVVDRMTNRSGTPLVEMSVEAIRERAKTGYGREVWELSQELTDIIHLLEVIEELKISPEIVIEA